MSLLRRCEQMSSSLVRPMRSPPRHRFLAPAPPTGPGWTHAVVARRTYRRRLGFATYDLAIQREGVVCVLRRGWRWVGRKDPPLVEVLDEGWAPRPH